MPGGDSNSKTSRGITLKSGSGSLGFAPEDCAQLGEHVLVIGLAAPVVVEIARRAAAARA